MENVIPEVGIKGNVGWILNASEFGKLLDLVYYSHFGEIWLYNNNLDIILEDLYFDPIYMGVIAGRRKSNIDAVKILIDKNNGYHVFSDKGGPSKELKKQLTKLHRVKMETINRLPTFYFGSCEIAREKYQELKSIPEGHTWVFYTHRAKLQPPNYGIVLVRPSEFPFYDPKKKEQHFSVAWQMTEDHILRPNVRKAFVSCFTEDESLFYHFNTPAGKPIQGWSDATSAISDKRQKILTTQDTLAFGEKADIAVITPRFYELDPLRQLFLRNNHGPLKKVPISNDISENDPESIVLETSKGPKKILLAEIGEGNLNTSVMMWKIIQRWSPASIILCGVAGADPNAEKSLGIGDVVFSEKVVHYEYGKIKPDKDNPDKWQFNGNTNWEVKNALYKAADRLSKTWPKGVKFTQRPKIPKNSKVKIVRPKARSTVIGSGGKVIQHPAYFDDVLKVIDEKIDTVEMEAAGVFSARNKDVMMLVVRGIMDHVNNDTRQGQIRDQLRPYACSTCCRFVYDLLCSL